MKLSKKGEYAIRALIDLGIAAEVGRSLVQVTELAEHDNNSAPDTDARLRIASARCINPDRERSWLCD